MVTIESSIEQIRKLLAEPQIQEELAALFAYYYDEVHVISDVATSEWNGIRPKELENEVYSCLHHIARGLAKMDKKQALDEINKGRTTHLKRLLLDAYKIAINSFLNEYSDLVNILRFFVLEDTFKTIDQNGTAKAVDISDTAGCIKNDYFKAKKLEASGMHEKASDLFFKVLLDCYDLREKIHNLTQGKLYQVAVAYMEKQRREKEKSEKRSRRWDVVKIILTAIISGLMIAPLSAWITGKILSERQAKALIESVDHGAPTTRQE